MSNFLISIDPGLRTMGAALFKDRVLIKTSIIRNSEDRLRGPFGWKGMVDRYLGWIREVDPDISHNWVFVSEWMQYYQHSRNNPDDLMQVAAIVGICSFVTIGDRYIYPARVWKGNIPKDEHGKTIYGSLTDDERALFDNCNGPKSLAHNALDAIGIGLFHLMRLRRV